MKYANGITCLCTVLACSGAVMAQGNGFGFSGGAPSIQQEKPSHSLIIVVTDNGYLISDADVTATAFNGAVKEAAPAADGSYFVDGIGANSTVNIGTREQGVFSVSFAIPAMPLVASVQIHLSGNDAKAVLVERAEIFNGAVENPFATVGGAPRGSIAGGCPSCCNASGVPGCENAECEALVCGIDPFCCDVAWDSICAGEANDLCPCCSGGPPPGDCPSCCNATGVPGCENAECEALVCGIDPFCCDVAWDSICAGEANDLCPCCTGGPPGGGCDCCAPTPGQVGCSDPDCEAAVCAVDPFCCDVAWDGICAGEAQDLCSKLCQSPECQGGPGCPCELGCAPGSTPEGEDCGADTNGGCNAAPPVFTPAGCGTWCGTAWAAGGTRDTDWYLVNHTGGVLSGTVVSQVPTVCFIVSGIPNCAPVVEGAIGCSSNCANTQVASANLPAGQYVVFVATGDCGGGGIFDGLPCSDCNTYNLTIVSGNCGPPPDPTGACCCGPDGCSIETEADCADLGGVYLGDDTACVISAGYSLTDCGDAFASIVGLPGTVLAPIASSSDDAGDGGIPIGFTFNFYGDDHATIGIASNGYLSFGGALGDFTNDAIPNAATPNDLIAPNWDDWAPNQAGDVYYRTTGSPGSRTFTTQWQDVVHFDTGAPATFQAILYETTNCIQYRYGTPLNQNSPTIGVENQSGTDGDPGGFGPAASSGDCFVICPVSAGDPCEGQCEPKGGLNVDIKPGICPNPFHLTGNPAATLTVVIVGKEGQDLPNAADLSIAGVSPISSNLGDVSTAGGAGNCQCGANGGDGVTDLVLNFQRTALQAALGLDAGDIGDTVEIFVDGGGGGSDCVVVQ